MTIEELRNKLKEAVERMDALIAKADEEKRDLTAEEETEYNSLDSGLDKMKADIAKRERLEAEKTELAKPKKTIRMAATYKPDNDEEFKSVGEFVYSACFAPQDKRMAKFYEEREQSMGVGAKGGFAIPSQFLPTLLALTPQEAIFRPRCRVIPAGDPPDAEVTMPALNQGAAENMYGGATVKWIGEGGTKHETDVDLKLITMKPHEVAAYVVLTDKLLRNWQAASAVISDQLRMAIIAAEENAFYNGTGVGQPLGVLSSPARINYNRAAANSISFADIVGMYSRLYRASSPVWIASQTCIPQLATIADSSSNNMWVQNAAPGLPPSLMGIPVLFHDRSVALGTSGDLVLADLGYYMIKDGSGPFIAASEHVYFTSNKTVIKIFWNVDGQPWLNEPIPLEGSVANTVSPFIVLN